MTFGPDDLTPLLVPPEPAKGLRYSQGVILSWDPDTFENEIEWRGITLSDLPVLPSVDALSFEVGATVGLIGWNPGGGSGSWWVLGRVDIPPLSEPPSIKGGDLVVESGGSVVVRDGGDIQVDSNGDVVVNGGDVLVNSGNLRAADGSGDVFRVNPDVPEIFMRQSLISDVARQIIGQAVNFDSVNARQTYSGSGFQDLSTVGPEVSGVEVGDAGVMLVFVSARIEVIGSGGGGDSGQMSYEVSGPTNRSPSVSKSANLLWSSSAGDSFEIRTQSTAPIVESGLSPGTYTVTAKYAGGTSPIFGRRVLAVIGF